jgi:hypothetical protein
MSDRGARRAAGMCGRVVTASRPAPAVRRQFDEIWNGGKLGRRR